MKRGSPREAPERRGCRPHAAYPPSADRAARRGKTGGSSGLRWCCSPSRSMASSSSPGYRPYGGGGDLARTRTPRGEGEQERSAPDPEVVAKPTRRQFTAEYRVRILEEADRCMRPGEVGRLLCREGLYTSHLSEWRKARRSGSLPRTVRRRRGHDRLLRFVLPLVQHRASTCRDRDAHSHDVHCGRARRVLEQRERTLRLAWNRHPERFVVRPGTFSSFVRRLTV